MSTSFTSYIVYIIYIVWFGSCNHRILACSLSFKNHGLCCFNSYRPRFYSALLMFSFMFSQSLFMFMLIFKFSKAANLFETLI